MKQICKLCGATAQDAEFYAGMPSRCKTCHKAKVKQNREANADYYKAYDAKRFQEDPRVKDRHKRYQSTDAGAASIGKSRKKWLEGNAEKRAAHVILGNAVRSKRIDKPSNCTVCGSFGRIEGHHEDYALPLVVKWLCRKCHVAEHREH